MTAREEQPPAAPRGRLRTRRVQDVARNGRPATGIVQLGLARGRDALLYVPAQYRHDAPMPLMVMLHGAGGEARRTVGNLQELAGALGLLVLVPESRGDTWDVIIGDAFGPDVAYLDRALEWTFARYATNRSGIGGFSDGASYALSLGLTNGDLFSHIVAFSPGFVRVGEEPRGAPKIYISHGTRDSVLPIDRCSRRIVPLLRRSGYDVTYREFDGPHTVPAEMRREGLELFLAS
ncbi:MAG TPA: phospholipase [Thermoanaerobaculia bacterium]|jgi:phospholipase/carboxylesterase